MKHQEQLLLLRQPLITTAATATFSNYVGTVRPGMSVSGTNVPAGTVVSYVVVNPTTNSITVHVTLANAVNLYSIRSNNIR